MDEKLIMRFGTDVFGLTFDEQNPDEPQSEQEDDKPEIVAPFVKKALLIAKTCLDCTNKSAVTRIIISGNEPADTKRRFMFKVDDKVWRVSSGRLVEYTADLTVDNVLKKGNTADQLNSLNGLSDLVGKEVYPIIALSAPSTATDFPTAKFQLETETSSETLTHDVVSGVFPLVNDDSVPQIDSIAADYVCAGGASVSIRVKLQSQDESWTDWLTLSGAADKEAVAVQFKFTYRVTQADSDDSAVIKSITVDHTLGKTVVSGEDADLFSSVVDYEVPLQSCHVTCRHEPLNDSIIISYVNFMPQPASRDNFQIGTASGSTQTIATGDADIIGSSIKLTADGVDLPDFDFDTSAGTVTFTATRGAVIGASYDYNHGTESWRRMTLERSEPYTDGETYASRFVYTLPDDQASGLTVSNVRLRLKRQSGRVTEENLGKATGKRQLISLPHIPKASSISFTSDDVDFTYNEDTQLLIVRAPKKTDLIISYKWYGEPVILRSFASAWSVA